MGTRLRHTRKASVALQSFSTVFSSVENPLDPTNFLHGGTDGLDWNDLRVSASGRCIGTQNQALPNYYSDSHALLKFTPTANHYARGTVYRASGNTNEVCLRILSSLSAHVSTGYELLFNNAGCQMVRWNGAIGAFSVDRFSGSLSSVGAVNGDVIEFRSFGGHLLAYKNSVLIGDCQDLDNMWTSGVPGLQTYQSDSPLANNLNFGFSSFEAGELAA